jgi:hypothetical protein
MLWTAFVLLLVLWVVGIPLHFAEGIMHLLVVLAVIILLYKLIADFRRPRPSN